MTATIFALIAVFFVPQAPRLVLGIVLLCMDYLIAGAVAIYFAVIMHDEDLSERLTELIHAVVPNAGVREKIKFVNKIVYRDRKMTKDLAYQVLGLQPGASAAEIKSAHRALQMKVHPDTGGTTYLATQVNQAKQTLTGG